jgi:hypothetical protein
MKLLDRLTNIAILLLCVAVGGDVIYKDVIGANRTTAAAAARPQPFKAGEMFPRLIGYEPEAGKSALLLVVRSGCHFCKESVPFYQDLARTVRSTNAPLQLVGVCLESSKACADYFAQTQVAVDVTVGAATGLEKIQGTPTLIMLDPAGKVARTWVGALKEDGQKDVIAALPRRS